MEHEFLSIIRHIKMHVNYRRKNVAKSHGRGFWRNPGPYFKSLNSATRRAMELTLLKQEKYDLLDSFEARWRRGEDRWCWD
jgi:hypothetical protein